VELHFHFPIDIHGVYRANFTFLLVNPLPQYVGVYRASVIGSEYLKPNINIGIVLEVLQQSTTKAHAETLGKRKKQCGWRCLIE
jgi:hypothetical protein